MTDYTKLVEALRMCQFGSGKCPECSYYGQKGNWPEDCDDKMHRDAADAIEALQAEVDEAKQYNTDLLNMKEMTKEEEDEILEYIRTTPVGPLEPMLIEQLPKRGEWIGVSPMVDTVQCSVCGGQLFSAELETPYCPYCGAKMEVQDG